MDASLLAFIRPFIGVVAASALPVVFAAFVSIPYTPQAQSGGVRDGDPAAERHFT